MSGRNSKAGGGVGKLPSGRKDGLRCALIRKCQHRDTVGWVNSSGHPMGLVRGAFFTFSS